MPTSVDTNVRVLPSGLALLENLDLVAGNSNHDPNTGAVEWLRLTDGSRVASIVAYDDATTGNANIVMEADAQGATQPATAVTRATANGTASSAEVGVQALPTGISQAYAFVNAVTASIIRGDGASSFIQNQTTGAPNKLALHGQYSIALGSIGAGAGIQTVVPLGFTLPAAFLPIGAVNWGAAIAFQDACSWAYSATAGSTNMTISVHNNSGSATGAQTNFFFYVLTTG